MLNPTEVIEKLKTANVKRVAAAASISTKTIYRLRNGEKINPTMKTLEALAKAMEAEATSEAA